MGYKLTYFPVRGRAEAIRYILKDNDIAFEDRRVTFAEWPSLKPSMPLGHLPIMDFGDGLVLSESVAILRHIAREHGLYGSDNKEKALIDQLADTLADLSAKIASQLLFQKDEAVKAAFMNELPKALATLEGLLKSNSGGSGFFIGNKISWADYKVFDLLDNLLTKNPNVLDTVPLLKGFHGRMAARPKIAAYRRTELFQKTPISPGGGKK